MSNVTDDAPIVVADNPARPTVEAAVRMTITVLAGVATALGYTKTAGAMSNLLLIAGPLAGLISMGWGLVATYVHASKSSQMANMLPDSKAQTK